MRKGFTLIELLIVIAIIAILAAIAVPNFLEAQTRAKVARVKADQRSLATGLEAYYVDNNRYPDWTCQGTGCTRVWTGSNGMGHINAFAGQGAGAASIHSFRVRTGLPGSGGNSYFMLTTPISYISSIMPDPFADTRGASYGYYSLRNGYIVYSFGPDADEAANPGGYIGDIEPAIEAKDLKHVVNGQQESLYNPNTSQPSITLICGPVPDWARTKGTGAFTYDPTNGTTSEGDVWRVKN